MTQKAPIFIMLLMLVALLSGCISTGKNAKTPLTAQQYLQLANNAQGKQKQSYLLKAVDRFSQNQQLTQAQQLLSTLHEQDLTPTQSVEKNILQAQLWIYQRHNQQAILQLQQAQASNSDLPNRLQAKIHQLLGQAYEAQGDFLASIDQRSEALTLIADHSAKQATLMQIWESVEKQPADHLHQWQAQANNDNEKGWISLALIAKQNSSAHELLQAISLWQKQFRGHVADRLLANLSDHAAALPHRPQQITLLLPLSGPLANKAKAIRNGFFAAYYQGKNHGYAPSITVINTANGQIIQRYQQAVQQGADFIVGPLTKQNVQQLLQQHAITRPTLALNNVNSEEVRSPLLFQFGLSPTDESQQVITRARQDQHQQIILITPSDQWGKNIADTFKQQWQTQGGVIVAELAVPAKGNLNHEIQQLLNIDKAEQRKRAIRYLTHSKLRFIPRRRQDFDAIFLVANPSQARQILPLLRFYYAGNIPVYALSTVFAGISHQHLDRDMNGVIFADMPWLVAKSQLTPAVIQTRQHIQQLWQRSYRQNARLYALGVDAYQLVPQLGKLTLLPHFSVNGATGTLYVLANQHVYRKLTWVQMRGGYPQLLPAQ